MVSERLTYFGGRVLLFAEHKWIELDRELARVSEHVIDDSQILQAPQRRLDYQLWNKAPTASIPSSVRGACAVSNKESNRKSNVSPTFSVQELKTPAFEVLIEPKSYAPAERIRVFRSKAQAEEWIKEKSKKWLAKHAGKIAG